MEHFQIVQINFHGKTFHTLISSICVIVINHLYNLNKHNWHKQVWEDIELTLSMC